ncbi:MAG: hypothetical protein ACOC0O_07000 [Spirochaetota bacterium]
MAKRDRMRDITRLMNEISSLNSRIMEHVYRRAWDRDLLRAMQQELQEKRRQLSEARTLRRSDRPPGLIGDDRPHQERDLDVHDTRLIANALFTQRPLLYQTDEWPAYRRVCASLVRLFAHELADSDFDSVEFLTHCGIALKDAEQMSRRPGDFIRRSEEARGEEDDA